MKKAMIALGCLATTLSCCGQARPLDSAVAAGNVCTAFSTKSNCPVSRGDDGRPRQRQQHLTPCGSLSTADERFLVIGDFGLSSAGCEARVASLAAELESLHGPVSFVATTGDNDYWDGTCATMSSNVGAHWSRFFEPGPECVDPSNLPSSMGGNGGRVGIERVARIGEENEDVMGTVSSRVKGAASQSQGGSRRVSNSTTADMFFPTIGNHDWDKFKRADDNGQEIPYLQYFDYLARLEPAALGAGQFYRRELLGGRLEIFSLNSNLGVPGSSPRHLAMHTRQLDWVRGALADSRAPFRVVFFHHPPKSTSQHDPLAGWMDVPFAEWGASAVLTGHQHVYERLNATAEAGGIPYVVNGLGGHPWLYDIHSCDPFPGSVVRYNAAHGLMIGGVVDDRMQMCFYSIEGGGRLVDAFSFLPGSGGVAPIS